MPEVKRMYQRIRDLREDRDLTQKNMGEILNCSQRIYSNYECGDVDIPTNEEIWNPTFIEQDSVSRCKKAMK